jgi:phosphoadenosine phosphosulfate reductase
MTFTETYTIGHLPDLKLTGQELVEWANLTFGSRLKLASSFGAEDIVLIDMLRKVMGKPRIFALDTGRLHEETYRTIERCREFFDVEFEIYTPDSALLQQMVSKKGPFSFYESIENRHECCGIRKVEPLRRALADADAWLTGLRRQQSVTRTELPSAERDDVHGGIWKLNPLADWSVEEVWEYIREHRLPYNKLHDQGFPSIGCEPCTRAIRLGEDIRAGRWWWESPEHKECGLHVRDQN